MRTLRDEAREHVLIHVKKIKRITPRHVRIELVKKWASTYDSLMPEQKQVSRLLSGCCRGVDPKTEEGMLC